MKDYYAFVNLRLNNRVETFKRRVKKALRLLDHDIKNNLDAVQDTERDRLWLDQFAVGDGLDICCGDFLIGDSVGVDCNRHYLGADYLQQGDELTFQRSEGLDFIVTNYLEAMPSTLNAFNEWYRCLKPGGRLALVCRNADQYSLKNPLGALDNRKRQTTYTSTTLSHYMYRADFVEVVIEETEHGTLRAAAVKRRTHG